MIHRSRLQETRRGSILLTVLIVVVLLTLVGMRYFEWTFSEHQATRTSQRQTQTRLFAESGIEFAKYVLTEDASTNFALGGLSSNPTRFQGVLVADSDAPALRGRFTYLAPALDNGEYYGFRYGLEDESSRLNLNALLVADARSPDANIGRTMLLALPGMTESIADAILDWIDTDSDVRDFGAELDYYSSLETPYQPQNGPLESLDQLLLVRDVTATLLYGADRNRNGVIDAGESTELPTDNYDNSTGLLNRGWAAYLTLYSAERNVRVDGTPKINVNQEHLQTLEQELQQVFDQDQTNFILAFRQGGPYEDETEAGGAVVPEADAEGEDTAASTPVAASSIEIDFEAGGSVPIGNILELVGVKTQVTPKGETERKIVETPFPDEVAAMSTFLPLLMDNLTTTDQEVLPGRVNVNQAPRVLLLGIPAMPPEIVEQIISMREFEPAPETLNRRYETWLLTEGLVTLDQMRELLPLLNAGGDVYRAQMVGYFEAEGPATRLEVLLDATAALPEVRWVTDLTPLGVGFTPEILGIETQ